MKNKLHFLIAIIALSLTLSCKDETLNATSNKSKNNSMAGSAIQHMDFDTIDIEPSSDFPELGPDMDL